ncbi:alpha/beta hydrolase [Actinotalea subterranea]|uniref:alpha/beta hydrolase n=1 Tax=Actinotalea subterranea TaxID=2607497 RepID=UPI0011EBB610|nr:alpha/beta hydrolase [Actinotalea subterranea]
MSAAAWGPDLLGHDWEQLTLDLGRDDDGGPLVATVARRTTSAVRRDAPAALDPDAPAVLYVHGFNDYFFQTHLAAAWEAAGYRFHAVDLRRCGRSLRPGQVPHYVTELSEYAPDLNAAARLVRVGLGHRTLVVMAHSTGGLTASLWAHSLRAAGVVDGLVLNSPWFDLNARWFQRVVSTRVLDAVGPLDPMRVVADGASAYSHHLHVDHGGRWSYDLSLKPPEGFPVRAGWLRAVRRGQARLARGLGITAPVLVCAAQESGPNHLDNPRLDRQDTVLDVRQIAARAPLLGTDVTLVRVPDGIHDLSLSDDVPRHLFLETVVTWADERVARHRAGRVSAG